MINGVSVAQPTSKLGFNNTPQCQYQTKKTNPTFTGINWEKVEQTIEKLNIGNKFMKKFIAPALIILGISDAGIQLSLGHNATLGIVGTIFGLIGLFIPNKGNK